MTTERVQESKATMPEGMEVYKRLAIPGAQHKQLESLVGSWSTRTRSVMEEGKPEVETTGTCEQKMILGGHYLQQEYAGDMGGEPFTGINLIGYDNHAQKYVSIWVDSMTTGIYYFEGHASQDGKTITQDSSYDDPVRGPMVWRSVTRFVDGNTLEYEMFMTPEGGKEEKVMEMTLTRRGGEIVH